MESGGGSGTGDGVCYLAFNEGRPRHYLASESVRFFKERNGGRFPGFILGLVVVVDRHVAAGPRGDRSANPFDLEPGTEFHLISVVSVP
mmetsp:Transcript_55522/g.126208  ORF Transcript_55522/g.126208 Transcript_55522/m.126208 type:complete len:89 (-) Transcript_55522:314-580(-)